MVAAFVHVCAPMLQPSPFVPSSSLPKA